MCAMRCIENEVGNAQPATVPMMVLIVRDADAMPHRFMHQSKRHIVDLRKNQMASTA